jgi:hypothetical protein
MIRWKAVVKDTGISKTMERRSERTDTPEPNKILFYLSLSMGIHNSTLSTVIRLRAA